MAMARGRSRFSKETSLSRFCANDCTKFSSPLPSPLSRPPRRPPPRLHHRREDSCGGCRNNDTLDYETMWAAIQASGRDMVLTTEGNPNNTACSVIGGCGNAKRVGHDIGV